MVQTRARRASSSAKTGPSPSIPPLPEPTVKKGERRKSLRRLSAAPVAAPTVVSVSSDAGDEAPSERSERMESKPVPKNLPLRASSSRSRSSSRGRKKMKPPRPAIQPPPASKTSKRSDENALRGLNLQTTSDFLAIPDPPSPSTFSQQRRRRLSMSNLPLADVTNSSKLERASMKKRARKSLSHVSSPLLLLDHDPMRIAQSAMERDLDFSGRDVGTSVRISAGGLKSMIIPLSSQQPQPDRAADDPPIPEIVVTSSSSGEEETKISTDQEPRRFKKRKEDSSPLKVSVRPRLFDQDSFLTLDSNSTATTATESTLESESRRSSLDSSGVSIPRLNIYARPEIVEPSSVFVPAEPIPTTDNVPVPASIAVKKKKRNSSHQQTSDGRRDDKRIVSKEVSSYFMSLLAPPDDAPRPPPRSRAAATVPSLQHEKSDLDFIRELAREYCALPLEERISSQQAYDLEKLANNYPLTKQDINPSSSDDEETSIERKQLLFERMRPIADRMDENKERTTAQLESAVQCKVDRAKTGKYRYRDTITNERLLPKEYERRYMQVMRREAAENRVRVRAFLAQQEPFEEKKPAAAWAGQRADEVVASHAFSGQKDPTTSDSDQSKRSVARPRIELTDQQQQTLRGVLRREGRTTANISTMLLVIPAEYREKLMRALGEQAGKSSDLTIVDVHFPR